MDMCTKMYMRDQPMYARQVVEGISYRDYKSPT